MLYPSSASGEPDPSRILSSVSRSPATSESVSNRESEHVRVVSSFCVDASNRDVSSNCDIASNCADSSTRSDEPKRWGESGFFTGLISTVTGRQVLPSSGIKCRNCSPLPRNPWSSTRIGLSEMPSSQCVTRNSSPLCRIVSVDWCLEELCMAGQIDDRSFMDASVWVRHSRMAVRCANRVFHAVSRVDGVSASAYGMPCARAMYSRSTCCGVSK
jgi:hypothetical protein